MGCVILVQPKSEPATSLRSHLGERFGFLTVDDDGLDVGDSVFEARDADCELVERSRRLLRLRLESRSVNFAQRYDRNDHHDGGPKAHGIAPSVEGY